MTSTGSPYYDNLRASGENLADRVKQASRRARLYDLEDDGASDLAQRKRSAKDSIATRRYLIKRIEDRQAGRANLPPRPQEEADNFIAAHLEAIKRLEEAKPEIGPAVNVLAPMTRRVAREDRRRSRRTKKRAEREP
ncbi:hypothetical protein [Pseudarthrobacter sp. BIM B-2242]|uniref:hypothetical protein n=1 Tax=Pseudarthrobacter sp. BIM B-2242 TaxID=2772401 RepID=UPI00168AC115|nr:hypothetical protein [Pseudarthrobacter sp. BIM B-2242]QOD06018.1 hypothetical protein IDT60_20860 [Pseudarthrobacter sp. BIM B-2242]